MILNKLAYSLGGSLGGAECGDLFLVFILQGTGSSPVSPDCILKRKFLMGPIKRKKRMRKRIRQLDRMLHHYDMRHVNLNFIICRIFDESLVGKFRRWDEERRELRMQLKEWR